MIRILQAAHPGVLINNEIVEPNPQHVAAYKGEALWATSTAWGTASTVDLYDDLFCCSVIIFFFYFLNRAS